MSSNNIQAIGHARQSVMGADSRRNALTVDVEDYFHVSALAGEIKRSSWNSMDYRAESNTDKLLQIFAEFDVRATFFVLGWVAERSPGLVRRIFDQGHEIACHGLSHELIYRQTPEVFASETARARDLLEQAIGGRVFGYRAASWSITKESLWALDTLCDLGFCYDSSIFPIRHDRYGIPDAPQWPGMMVAPSGREIAEFPPSTVNILGTRMPVAGGGYFRIFPYWFTRGGLAKINRDYKQAFMFYLHPWELDPQQPRFNAGLLSRFRHYTNLGKTESRLRRLLTDFRFTTAYDVLKSLNLAHA